MNRKIVFKSSLFVTMLGFVLLFSACKEERKIIGKWEYKKAAIKELSTTNLRMESIIRTAFPTMFPTVMPYIVGNDFNGITEFTKKGKIIYHGTNGGKTATYKINDTKLTITSDDGKSVTYDYSFPDKKTMYWDINVIEIYGEMLAVYLQSAGIEMTKFVVRLTFEK